MNIRKIFLIAFTSLLLSSLFTACNSKKEKQHTEDEPTEFELAMTNKDTIEVKQLVDQFFTYVKGKNFTDAAGMLYRNDVDSTREPQPLDNRDMAQVRAMLRSIPMVDYKIEYIKFNEDYANEVLCNVLIQKGENGEPDITTKMFFKPVMVMGKWMLCLTNSEYGDKGVVRPNKRDSIEKDYAHKDSLKAVKKK